MTLIDDIRAKYVGTADEHALLADLADDFRETLVRVENEHRTELAKIRESIECDNAESARLISTCPLDCEVYRWLNSPASWSLQSVADAMLGRGLTSEKLREVMDCIEVEEARRIEVNVNQEGTP